MGCFLGCFGATTPKKERKRRPNKKSPRRERCKESYKLLQQPTDSLRLPSLNQITPRLSPEKPSPDLAIESIPAPVPEIRDTNDTQQQQQQQQRTVNITKKRVTFDLNVKTYENTQEIEIEEEYYTKIDPQEITEKEEEQKIKLSPKINSFPLNHRYQNCENSGNEEELELELESESESELEEEEEEEEDYFEELEEEFEDINNTLGIEQNEEAESYDSFFSISVGKENETTKNNNTTNDNSSEEEEIISPIISKNGINTRDRSKYVHPVLNPVENLSQWKEAKGKTVISTPVKGKENEDEEVSVDASLSTWLIGKGGVQGGNFTGSDSVRSDERPILGALTVDDIKSSSVNSSPRRSPSRKNPDEIPILGTVGSYWSLREDKVVAKCR